MTTRRNFLKSAGAAGIALRFPPPAVGRAEQAATSSGLDAAFSDPPSAARPGALWHWMNGHVSREGITLDLEAMQRVGIGSVFNFDAGTGIPKGPVLYLSPEWLELKAHAIREAERLGLEFVMHNCPGWSSSGGPWITPEMSMQEVTWSETRVGGGKEIDLVLPPPHRKLGFYQDAAVVAYPALPGEGFSPDMLASATTSDGTDVLDRLGGGPVVARPGADGATWLSLRFKEAYRAGAISFLTAAVDHSGGGGERIALEGSDDGNTFHEITAATLGIDGLHPTAAAEFNAEFPDSTHRFFRIRCGGAREISQLRLSGLRPFPDWRKRANFTFNGRGLQDIGGATGTAIDPDTAIDLTNLVDPQGRLRWDAPAGDWTVLRFGFTPTGEKNHASPDTGLGLECDKFSRSAIDFHFAKMMERLLPILKGLTAKGMAALEIDSYEVGMQNWTPGFENEFRKRAGYDLTRYLPALAGRVVGTPETTEGFLWDLRRVQGDLFAENYYGRFRELCHEHGLRSVIEPYDRGPMEEMQIGARADLNMGEFWHGLSAIFQNNWTMRRTSKLAASIAHTNGQNLVLAESFTAEPEAGRWQAYPFALKGLGDRMFTQGVNRFVVHRFAHQPHPTAVPGMTMGPWGMHFDRTVTWWEPGKAWIAYLTRCQGLLQQGLFVADLAYFSGEGAGLYTKINREELVPPPPSGFDYDVINAETILRRGSVKDGRLTLADGMSYRVLFLQDTRTLSLPLLRKLTGLVRAGLILVGGRPEGPPGLPSEDDEEFQSLADELWGDEPGPAPADRPVGEGRVLAHTIIPELLQLIGLVRDFGFTSRSGDAPVLYIHRRAGTGEIYFLSNQRRTTEDIVAEFRVAGMQPEIWDPVTGTTHPAVLFETDGDITRVPLTLDPYGSVFVVFRKAPERPGVTSISLGGKELASTGPFPAPSGVGRADAIDNFTIHFHAKPENHIMLTTDGLLEGLDGYWTEFHAVHPPAGATLFGAGHGACGVTVGRNGVAIWERTDGKPKFVLAAPCKIAGWSHVAVVYRDGAPEVFVNGESVARGARSPHRMHPGVGPDDLADGASYFNGDMTSPVVELFAMDHDAIQVLAGRPLSLPPAREPSVQHDPGKPSAFHVFQNGRISTRSHNGSDKPLPATDVPAAVALAGPWQVRFPAGTGAPERIALPNLASLRLHDDPAVRHFSGTARYLKRFTLPQQVLGGNRSLFLDLGRVEVLAEVILNGTNLGVLWSRPYRIDITSAAVAGTNSLEIRVTNLWINRLIGDEFLPEPHSYAPGAGQGGWASLSAGALQEMPDWYLHGQPKPKDGRVTFATWKHYTKESPLVESGLLGPVRLLPAEVVTV